MVIYWNEKMGSLRLLAICLLVHFLPIQAQDTVEVEVDVHHVENRIDDKLYGFLLEHLYHSVSNGIWGENVWNRSFEELSAYGDWEINSRNEISLNALGKPMADFHIGTGQDYELSLEARVVEGVGPVLVGLRDQARDRMLTNRIYWYLGARDEPSCRLEMNTGWVWHTPVVKTVTEFYSVTWIPGEWMKVRVRCEDERIVGWVGGKTVFDRTVEQCPKDGFITLGGKDCRVQFRNVHLVPLPGSHVEMNMDLARHWKLVGKGALSTVHTDVLNDKTALRVRSSGTYAGIEQPKKYSLRKDDVLRGSLFLKGSVDKVYVRMWDGEGGVAEQVLRGISGEWNEFPLDLPSHRNVAWATLQVIVKEKGDLFVDQVSLMHQSSIKNQGFRVGLADAVSALRPTVLRWPGGSFSEHYRFENGIGRQPERKGILRWDDFDPLSFGTDEFLAFCEKVGAEPLVVVPIGYHNYAGYAPDKDGKQDWLQRALDWMDYCNGDARTTEWGRKRAENGRYEPYGVKYWEIDNEVWKMNPELYAEIARLFSIEMKKRYPYVKIIGCGCGRLGREGAGLDSIMIHGVGEYFDYISPHYYQTLSKYGNDGVEEYGRYLDKLAAWIAKSKNPDMRIFLSEWNLEGTDMRTGLFAGGFLNRLECTPAVEMAAGALFLRHTSATGWDNAFINFDQEGWFPAPNYVVFKLWRDNFLPNRIRLSGETDGLNVVATASDDKTKVCLKIVNPTGEDMVLDVRGCSGFGKTSLKVVRAALLTDANSMENPDKVKVEEGHVEMEEDCIVINVPPYSASVLSAEKN